MNTENINTENTNKDDRQEAVTGNDDNRPGEETGNGDQITGALLQENGNDINRKSGKKDIKGKLPFVLIGLIIGLSISPMIMLLMIKIKGRDGLQLINGPKLFKKDTFVSKQVDDKIKTIENSIEQNYFFDVTDKELEEGIYEGMLEATGDRYADYYTKDDIKNLQEKTTGVFYGIGAYVGIDQATNYPKLTGIMEKTPAEEAGLKAGDIVIEVDGENVRGMELSDVVSRIKGDRGTTVVLKIYRNGENEYRDITVTRDKVESPTVTYEKMDDGMAYIYIHQFESVTSGQFEEKLKQARDDKMKGLILDLRGNPGGTLESVINIARQILPEGLIVYTEDKYGNRNEYKCDGHNKLEVPLVVLVNEDSASASEILSGAIKDYGIGKLVGKNTYGKGIVQKVFYISDGTAMKLTVSHYYTPKGNDIHEVGIKPDVDVDLDVDKYLDEDTDTQLEKAKEVLKGMMDNSEKE